MRKLRGVYRTQWQAALREAPPKFRKLLEAVKWDRLPSAKELARYASVGAACLIPEENGLLIVGVDIMGKAIRK